MIPVSTQLPLGRAPLTTFSSNSVSVLWYPNESHTELAIGNKIYQSFSGYYYKRTLEESVRVAENGGSGFYRFTLDVNDEELAKLKAYIHANEDRHSEKICVRGASDAVTLATGMPVPFPFGISPLWNGAFLSAAYYSGLTRVTGMDRYGQRPLLGIGAAVEATVSAASALALSGAGLAGYLGVQWLAQ